MKGPLILDRFRILDELGRGGFGTVYRAWDERLERQVAVKVIARGRAAKRVLREAQAAARLNHSSIVTLYELGEDDSAAYLVSELVDGENLRALLAKGELSDRAVAEAGASICDGLAHAHARGVVHRDVKPENIALLNREHGAGPSSSGGPSRAMLMDFGVASLGEGALLTATGEVVGTLAYMAPEQAEGEPAGPQADLYSLGLILYEAWSGQNPVVRATPAATARAIGAAIPPLAQARPDLPAELAATVDACLDCDYANRPDAIELREELRHALAALDGSRSVPAPRSSAHTLPARLSLARLAGLAALAGGLVWLAWGVERPGLALVLTVLALPAPLLIERVRNWATPLAAPLLGSVGFAPLFPAVAGLAGGPLRSAGLALLGWCWLAVTEAVLGKTLLLAPLDRPPPGWETSPQLATEGLLLPLLLPASLAAAAAWTAAAALLGWLLDARSLVVRVVGALCWGAGLVAIHRLLASGTPDPATASFVAILAATLAIGIWARSTPRAGERRGISEEAGPAAVLRGTA